MKKYKRKLRNLKKSQKCQEIVIISPKSQKISKKKDPKNLKNSKKSCPFWRIDILYSLFVVCFILFVAFGCLSNSLLAYSFSFFQF